MIARLFRYAVYNLFGFPAFGLLSTGYCRLPKDHEGACVPEVC